MYVFRRSGLISAEQERDRGGHQCPWRRWKWRDGCMAGQWKVIYFRWPARSSGLKLSLLIWLLYFAFPPTPRPPTESTLLLQLLQTEKVMGLRFCPDKGVRTLSLLLTPLSHQWDQGSRKRGRRGVVNHSLPPSSCLKPSASELSLAPLYLIMGCSRVDRFSQFYYSVSCQLKRDFRGVHILWLCFRIACPVPR